MLHPVHTRSVLWSVTLRDDRNRPDVDSSIREVLEAQRREANPPVVPAQDGWSPYAAVDFLTKEGVTGDYHRSDEEVWSASAPYLELGHEVMPDNIAYYVQGDALFVKQLKLVLNVSNPNDAHASEATFETIARILLTEALGPGEAEAAADATFRDGETGMHVVLGRTIRLLRDDWSGGIGAAIRRR